MADNKKTELLKPVLQLGKECICPRVETLEGDGDDFFKMLEKNTRQDWYQSAIWLVHTLVFAWYDGENKKFIFPEEKRVDPDKFDKYLVEARLFRSDEEILIQKHGSCYAIRKIVDEAVENSRKREYVDSLSPMFGSVSQTDSRRSEIHSFVHLVDEGRGFQHSIPVLTTQQNGKTYCLKTRSYISYDEDTGQAGYDMYRYVEIDRVR